MTNEERSNFSDALIAQAKALQASCASFDAGSTWEATRIATAVHTIVHDASKRNKSILTRLGAKSTSKFLASSYVISPKNLMHDAPLTMMSASLDGGAYLPLLEQSRDLYKPRWISFTKWWQEDWIYSSGAGKDYLSRKKLVFALRNKEGGSHFDPNIKDNEYLTLKDSGFIVETSISPAKVVKGCQLASMRQIGWETIETLKHHDLIDF